MFTSTMRIGAVLIVIGMLLFQSGCAQPRDVVRPEKIYSKRQVIHDDSTYVELARLWKAYDKAFPSEDAYANWMYAARYAGDQDYEKLLLKGLDRYPANPTLLYLAGILHSGDAQELDQERLERAAELDPSYNDPWFALVTVYMQRGGEEKLDLALRKLLEGGAVSEEVMDYNYNVLSGLDSNAILITNGDNDTYPCWILQRILNYRTDVVIANRSLLNTDWYPLYLTDHGLMRFITQPELSDLRVRRKKEAEEKGGGMFVGGPFGDSLVVYLTESAKRAGRSVYFALTLYDSEILKPLKEAGTMLGLAIRVSPAGDGDAGELVSAMRQLLSGYRTGGLDSWRMHYGKQTDAGRWLLANYAWVMIASLDTLKVHAPELRGDLFEWYQQHLVAVIPERHRERLEQSWCQHDDVDIIREWCRKAGLEK